MIAASAAAQSLPGGLTDDPGVSTALYFDAVKGSTVHGGVPAGKAHSAGLAYSLASAPKHGQVTLSAGQPGNWVYQPEASFVGYDEFRVSLGEGPTTRTTRLVISLTEKPTRLTYFVDAARGKDTNPGSAKDPFATIQAAQNVTRPGDTVLIRNGTYQQTSNEGVLVITHSGLPGAMITYKAYPGEHPILHAATAWNHILVMASYVRIEGLEIAGNAAKVTQEDAAAVSERFIKGTANQSFGPETSAYETNGISIRPEAQNKPADQRIAPRHVEVVHTIVHDVQGGGLSAMWSDYLLFEKNVIHDTSYRAMYATSGISVLGAQNTDNESPSFKIFILGNLVYRNRTEVKWEHTKAMSDGNGIIIDSNRNKGDKVGPYAGRMLIANNVVYESGGAGIQVYSSDNVSVLHNTVVRNSLTPGLRYGQIWVHQASNVLIENNIAVAGTGDGSKINEAFKDTQNVVYDYNLYFGGNKPDLFGAHDKIADPHFLDEKTGNFHLDAASPAVGVGNPQFLIHDDFDGHVRPANAPVDAGAFQH